MAKSINISQSTGLLGLRHCAHSFFTALFAPLSKCLLLAPCSYPVNRFYGIIGGTAVVDFVHKGAKRMQIDAFKVTFFEYLANHSLMEASDDEDDEEEFAAGDGAEPEDFDGDEEVSENPYGRKLII